uniref:Uncharacterized protein n=1 Tax=Rhodosorus marinus TaxID=101924 RepID=A0A7S0G6I2_9RHOD|mmetsp:Transcript_3178/g.4559  ORF Transcript_3178/g.4559 Transcript_3178/m.4559 type:complete len:172 (+) Transcript_3178:187-702(+)
MSSYSMLSETRNSEWSSRSTHSAQDLKALEEKQERGLTEPVDIEFGERDGNRQMVTDFLDAQEEERVVRIRLDHLADDFAFSCDEDDDIFGTVSATSAMIDMSEADQPVQRRLSYAPERPHKESAEKQLRLSKSNMLNFVPPHLLVEQQNERPLCGKPDLGRDRSRHFSVA